ncbi:MAG: TRAP transporter small permease subunit [Pseudomonadota bacterium]|nr:TRAP transporter small permease subunit [Pseudomonadota bacterium]
MSEILNRLEVFCNSVGRCVAWLTLIMVFVTSIIVIGRYWFDLGSVRLQESLTYMHAAVLLLASAYTLASGGHVRVDIFYSKFSEKVKGCVNLVGTLFLLFPFCIFLIWFSLDYVALAWQIRESSKEAGGLPFPFPVIMKSLIPLASFLILIQGIVIAAKSLLLIHKRDH